MTAMLAPPAAAAAAGPASRRAGVALQPLSARTAIRPMAAVVLARSAATPQRQGGAVPSAQTAVLPLGTMIVVFAGGEGLLLLMQPATPSDSGGSNAQNRTARLAARPFDG